MLGEVASRADRRRRRRRGGARPRRRPCRPSTRVHRRRRRLRRCARARGSVCARRGRVDLGLDHEPRLDGSRAAPSAPGSRGCVGAAVPDEPSASRTRGRAWRSGRSWRRTTRPPLRAAQPRVDAGAERDDGARSPRPAATARRSRHDQRSQSPPPRALTSAAPRSATCPPSGGPSPTTRPLQLDHPVGDPRDLAVVGDDQDRHARRGPARAAARGSARRCGSRARRWARRPAGPGCRSRAPGRSPRAAARRRTAGGGSGRPVAEPDPLEHVSAARSWLPVTSTPNCTFSSAVSVGNRLKVWKTKLTVSRRKRNSSVRDARGDVPATDDVAPRWASPGRRRG